VTRNFDAIVLGAGAAGLMCAIEAGRRGKRVALIEHADRVGKKILISGGGRCNFTNLHCKPENFLSANPYFARSALARYTPADFIALVEKHGIAYHEKTLGQLFCDGSAKEIVAMLLAECADAGVEIFLNQHVQSVRRGGPEQRDGFAVVTQEAEFHAPAIVVATGGLSISKMGATSFGYEIAEQFGIAIQQCRPALAPLLLDQPDQRAWCDLAGVSAEVIASAGRQKFREKLLITHRGLSGPAILQISSYWRETEAITIDWAPEKALTAELVAKTTGRDATSAKAALRAHFSARLADRLIDLADPLRWTNAALQELEKQLHHWQFEPDGTEGYEKAEVTAGGIDTNELSAKTMEAKRVPSLHFIGEVVDVTGHLGGFNFQWAWASGAAAGRSL
jgi:predicted Rossmann fold flavoprotein